MLKFELNQKTYSVGNETVTNVELLLYLEKLGFILFFDEWPEGYLYNGRRGNELLEIDRIFGSTKFGILPNIDLLHSSARKILKSKFSAIDYHFGYRDKDVIAIKSALYQKMSAYFFI